MRSLVAGTSRAAQVDQQTVKVMPECKPGMTALMLAAQHGHTSCVRELLHYGARGDLTDQDGTTPLMFASRNGHLQAVRALFDEQGSQTDPNQAKPTGMTSLMFAAKNGFPDVVHELLSRGADAHRVNSRTGRTALDEARINAHAAVADTLVHHGAPSGEGTPQRARTSVVMYL